ncbi:MAG: DUF1549 domain-containing protein [Planctomycetota bacterium]|nr:MAG: DUF1549 domain-containing protein [Planctomycetota bacterium]
MRLIETKRRKGEVFTALLTISALCVSAAGCGGSGGGGGGGSVAAGSTSKGNIGPLVGVEVYPSEPLTIDNDQTSVNAGFQLVVDAKHSGGTVDATREAEYVVEDPSIVQVTGSGLIQPLQEGSTKIAVSYQGRTEQVEVTVVAPAATQPNLVSMEIYPETRNFPRVSIDRGVEEYQQLAVLARDDQGRLWDYTRSVMVGIFDTNNKPSNLAVTDSTGLMRARADGEVIAVARIASAALVFGANYVFGAGDPAQPVDTNSLYSGGTLGASTNPLDQAILTGLFGQLIEPAAEASDGEFLRRLYSDALGRTPTEQEYMAFAQNNAPTKRSDEVEKVLADPAFATRWGSKFGEWFQMKNTDGMAANASAFEQWAATQITNDTPIADMFAELARGNVASFETLHDNAAKKVDILLLAGTGMTAKCAVCHDHPLTGPNDTIRWVQADRYPLDAFFATNNSEAIPLDKFGVRSGNNGNPYQPAFTLDPTATVNTTLNDPVGTRRAEFATLFTKSAAFYRGMGHRIFGEVCGNLLDPNQFLAANLDKVKAKQVLDALQRIFAQNNSLKAFLRVIFNSAYYQLSSAMDPTVGTAGDEFLARRVLRRAQAECVDANLSQATGNTLGGGDRDFLLQTFGFNFTHEQISGTIRTPNMSQAFVLLNSPVVQDRVTANGGQVAQLAQAVSGGSMTQADAIRSLFRSILTREPAQEEIDCCVQTINGAANVREGLEDCAAALFATTEFVTR